MSMSLVASYDCLWLLNLLQSLIILQQIQKRASNKVLTNFEVNNGSIDTFNHKIMTALPAVEADLFWDTEWAIEWVREQVF